MKLNKKWAALSALVVSASAVLIGCGGYVYTSVGGTVTGLGTGNSLRLANEKNYVKDIMADGPFSFEVASNAQYNVFIVQQPSLVNCSIQNGSGKMTGENSVTNIKITCEPNVPVGGTLTNLDAGKYLTLALNDEPQGTISANGAFTLTGLAVNAKPYKVSIYFPPAAQVCTVLNSTGTADINNPAASKNVAVNCVAGVQIGGSLAGLKVGKTVGLINGTDERVLNADGPFNLTFSVLDGTDYDIQVKTQPIGQKCTVVNGKGKALITNPSAAQTVSVTCISD